MMQFIRDRAQGWFATVLLGFLCIPFGLWGVQSYLDASGQLDVAVVDGDAIPLPEYRQAYERVRSALEAQLGEQAAGIDPALQKQEVLDQLLRGRLIRHYASSAGMRVSDPTVASEITRIPAFQSEGVFSPELYADRLRNTGLSRRGFEEEMREEILQGQFRQGVLAGGLTTETEIEDIARLRGERRDIDVLQLSVDSFAERIQPSDEELRDWFEAHRDDYRGEPSARVEYVTLAADSFTSDASPDDSTLQALYEENRDRFVKPEERRARHILVELARDADPLAEEAARSRAVQIRERLIAGEDFAAVAAEVSDDPGTSRMGGDLGFFARGVMDAGFEAGAFSLAIGQISEPVRSAYGFHIIDVPEIREGKVQTFEEVRSELLVQWQREEGERRYFEALERLETLAFESGDNLQALADALGLEVMVEADFSSANAKGALTSNAVILRVFDPEFAASGLLSEPIEVGTNRVVVLKVAESRPASLLEFDQARTRVTADFREAAARAQVEARSKELLALLADAADPASRLAEGETLRKLEGVTRSHPDLPRAAARLAFRVPAEQLEKDGPQTVSTFTGAGNFILAVVRAARRPETVDAGLRNALDMDAWSRAREAAELAHVEAELRRRADIQINEQAL
jgi:peptidyl-prolyl cis-trans isomerase D